MEVTELERYAIPALVGGRLEEGQERQVRKSFSVYQGGTA